MLCKNIVDIKYAIGQLEKGEEGTPHLQIALHF